MAIKHVYQLVRDELERIEETIKLVSQVESPWQRELLEYCLGGGGKRLRPVLTILAGKLYTYHPEKILAMSSAVELMHTATLVHDDAIDKSDVRRGRATINKLWGEEAAILLGDYLFARAGEFATDTGNILVVKIFTRTLQIISSGELNQAKNAFNMNQTREQYVKRIAAKTASLFSLAVESGAILCQAPEKVIVSLKDYAFNMGVAFQIVDDILDYTGTEEEMGKPIGADLAAGTLTLPAMVFLERYPGDNPVRKLFQEPSRKEYIGKAIELIRNPDIIAECYQVATEYVARAHDDLKIVPDSAIKRALKDIAEYVVSRKK